MGNNNQNAEAAGGTHWQLLLYFKGHFYLFDSLRQVGATDISTCNPTIEKLMLLIEDGSAVEVNLDVVDVARQTNSVDCGVYCLAFAELALEQIQTGAAQLDFSALTDL